MLIERVIILNYVSVKGGASVDVCSEVYRETSLRSEWLRCLLGVW